MFGHARISDYTELRCAQPDLNAGVKILELSTLMKARYYVNFLASVLILLLAIVSLVKKCTKIVNSL